MPQEASAILVTPEQVLKSLGALPEAERYVAAEGIYNSGRHELLREIFSLGSAEAERLFTGTLEVIKKEYMRSGADFAYAVGRKETAAQIYDSIGDDLTAAKVWKEAGNVHASRKSFLNEIEKKKAELSRASRDYEASQRAEELVKLERAFGSLGDSSRSHVLVELLRENRQYEISAKVLEELGREDDAKQDLKKAAEVTELKDNLSGAADLFEKAGMPDRAREILLKSAIRGEMKGEYGWAARAYKRVGNMEEAKRNWRRHVQQIAARGGDRYHSREDHINDAIKAAAEWGMNDLALEICMGERLYGQGAKYAEALGDKEKAETLRMLDELTTSMG